MAISLNNNIPSLTAQRELHKGTNALSKVFERLSSGLRINKASDDAAGLSVATTLRANSTIYLKAINNINDSISAISLAEGGLQALSTIMQRQSELAEQASNGTISTPQRKALQSESDALTNEFNRIVATTTFNGNQLLSGSGFLFSTQAGISSADTLQQQTGSQLSHSIGTGYFGTAASYASSLTNARAAESYDLNGDGYMDVVLGDQSAAGGKLSVLISNGNGTFAISQTMAGVNSGSTDAAYDIQFGDANGDGVADVLVTERSNSTVGLYLGNGNGTFQTRQQIASMPAPMRSFLVDTNRDGKQDLVSVTHGNILYTALGNGNGTFQATISTIVGDGDGGTDGVTLADFNGDGLIDVATGDFYSATVGIALGRGNGTFANSRTVAYPAGSSRQIKSADLNRDGRMDLIVYNAAGIATLLGKGDGSFHSAVNNTSADLPSNTGYFSLEVADFNNDGYYDLLANHAMLLGQGDGSFQAAICIGASNFSDSAVGDFNGDGVLDLLTASFIGNYTVRMASTTAATVMEHFNIMTQSDAQAALTKVSVYQERVTRELGSLGSQLSRLSAATSHAYSMQLELESAASRIFDVDIAQESAELVRKQIQLQATTAVLTQANQLPSLALKLLR